GLCDGSIYNEQFGSRGSKDERDNNIKLFPRDCQPIVDKIQTMIKEKTGKTIEVMVYGDGAFKDPVGKIWELADPVVSPAYTGGLNGTPNEIKLKYLADNDFSHLKGDELDRAIRNMMQEETKDENEQQETTPRHLTDLIGSLTDLTSGSGEKVTPIVHIQGYFDNYNSY